MNKEATIYTIIFIFIVSFAFVFLLSLTNQATIAKVELNAIIVKQRAVLDAMGIAAATPEEVQAKYAELRTDEADGLYSAPAGVVPGASEAIYASDFAGPGLWGTITGVLAVQSDLKKIVGIEFISDTETPGLGARINEAWFKNQFRGEAITGTTFRVVQLPGDGDPDKTDGVVDGITGATRTSDSVQAIVNRMLQRFADPQVQTRLRDLASQGGAQ